MKASGLFTPPKPTAEDLLHPRIPRMLCSTLPQPLELSHRYGSMRCIIFCHALRPIVRSEQLRGHVTRQAHQRFGAQHSKFPASSTSSVLRAHQNVDALLEVLSRSPTTSAEVYTRETSGQQRCGKFTYSNAASTMLQTISSDAVVRSSAAALYCRVHAAGTVPDCPALSDC